MHSTPSLAVGSTPQAPIQPSLPADYQAGVCNIGPAEIARRRRAGHVGLAITVGMVIGLVAIGAPPLLRLVLVAPAAVAASGYLQASLKFCAAFGRLGVYNFGRAGQTSSVGEAAARAADRRKANQIGFASLVIGLAVAIVAALLPV